MTDYNGHVGLASASPRRRSIIEGLGLVVTSLPAGIDESRKAGEPVRDYVARLAREKAGAVADAPQFANMPLIAGDTAVALGEILFDKPENAAEAEQMLLRLSGRTHEVHTSLAVLWDGNCDVAVVSSEVTFADITRHEAASYWRSGEPEGKAGGYAIQGLGGRFVKHLSGSFTAVMGLPVFELWQRLSSLSGWSPQRNGA